MKQPTQYAKSLPGWWSKISKCRLDVTRMIRSLVHKKYANHPRCNRSGFCHRIPVMRPIFISSNLGGLNRTVYNVGIRDNVSTIHLCLDELDGMDRFGLFTNVLFKNTDTAATLLHSTVCYMLRFAVPIGFVTLMSLHPQQVNHLQANVMPLPIALLAKKIEKALSELDFAHSLQDTPDRCQDCAWIKRKTSPSMLLSGYSPAMNACVVFKIRGPVAQCGDIHTSKSGPTPRAIAIPDCVEWLYLSSFSTMRTRHRPVGLIFLASGGGAVDRTHRLFISKTGKTEHYITTNHHNQPGIQTVCLQCCVRTRGSVLECPLPGNNLVTTIDMPVNGTKLLFGKC